MIGKDEPGDTLCLKLADTQIDGGGDTARIGHPASSFYCNSREHIAFDCRQRRMIATATPPAGRAERTAHGDIVAVSAILRAR